MSILNIVIYPNPTLRNSTFEVKEITNGIKSLVLDLIDTMYSMNAIGLAAIQVGRLERIFVIDSKIVTDSEKTDPLIFINPEILEIGKDFTFSNEGCLSFPNIFINVQRPSWVKMKALDLKGNFFETEGDGLFGRCLQHEYDHLQGDLMIDKANFFERRKNRTEDRET